MEDLIFIKRMVNKAENNNFDLSKWTNEKNVRRVDIHEYHAEKEFIHMLVYYNDGGIGYIYPHLSKLIFDKKFMQGFFGEAEVCANCGFYGITSDHFCAECDIHDCDIMIAWKHYGMKMLESDDRLMYLKDFSC